MAVAQRRPGEGIIHHADRGCQYTAVTFGSACRAHGITQSNSRKGQPARQRRQGKLLRLTGKGAAAPADVRHPRTGPQLDLPVHRGVLQPATVALDARVPLPRRDRARPSPHARRRRGRLRGTPSRRGGVPAAAPRGYAAPLAPRRLAAPRTRARSPNAVPSRRYRHPSGRCPTLTRSTQNVSTERGAVQTRIRRGACVRSRPRSVRRSRPWPPAPAGSSKPPTRPHPTHSTAPVGACRSLARRGSANVTMLASSCPMNAPMQTVPTTNQGARGLMRTLAGLLGSVSTRRLTQ